MDIESSRRRQQALSPHSPFLVHSINVNIFVCEMMSTEEKSRSISQLHDGRTACESETQAVDPLPKMIAENTKRTSSQQEKSLEMSEETSNSKQWRKPNLSLEIPNRASDISPQEFVQITMPTTPTPTPKRVNFHFSPSGSRVIASCEPSSTRGKSSIKNFLPKLSFKYRAGSNSDAEKAPNFDSVYSTVVKQDKPSIARSWSLSKIFTSTANRTSSLPVTWIGNSNPDSAHGGSINGGHPTLDRKDVRVISRSLSIPVINKEKCILRMNSFFRVIPSTPRAKDLDADVSLAVTGDDARTMAENNEANGEDIPEDEAVCRICFVELCEGGETLKMECSCKGELALAHQDCAIKWVWQDLPILVIVSMLGYFCFLEQLLAKKMDSSSIAISVPFSCLLGLLASMTSSLMVKRRFVWVYASIQFAFVVVFAHIFYNLVHVQAIVSIFLSTFAGFGIAMSGGTIIVEALRWRGRRRAITNQNEVRNELPPSRVPPPSQIATPSYISPRLHRNEEENPATFRGS
ncbi:hypothetical protein BUALT_Bualt02G0047400 [Buddleja alternifolia]|uniref:RING-CH-type domain-containing protein n=1 Tax=Buddleja alternifolia TaxID=168488 RepID=A0AAV6XY12_9LAMI|nr:hypothetical protein BUALT_Bualt02G0047400 [Buddleja alternifolia]